MRTFFAKILFSLATGLLFGHQVIAHWHSESGEIVVTHHDDDSDGHHHHFPSHNIAHIFSFDNVSYKVVHPVQEICFHVDFKFDIQNLLQIQIKKEYLEVPPPLLYGYKYFALRAPPVA